MAGPKINREQNRIAVYPGSFDPITLGHVDVIRRAARLFERVVVLIAESGEKQSLFSVEERVELIKKSLRGIENYEVDVHDGLTIDYLNKRGSRVLIRGLRAVVDFEYEVSMANINRKLAPEIETILILASPEYYFISSRAVKEVARYSVEQVPGTTDPTGNVKGSMEDLVTPEVAEALVRKLRVAKKGGQR